MSSDLNIEYIPVSALKPYEHNARKHGQTDLAAIIASIREFGFNDPIGLWKDNVIIEGHGRLLAAIEIGMDAVPCIRLDHLTDEQRRAYALAHNRTAELSEWNFEIRDEELAKIFAIDMSAFGFDAAEEDPDIVEDEPPAIPTTARTKTGDIYQLGPHRLICGDCTDPGVLEDLATGSMAELLLTDPPYNVDYSGKNVSLNKAGKGNHVQTDITNDKMEAEAFRKFLSSAFREADQHMKAGAAFYVWCVDNQIPAFMDAIPWRYHQTLIWVKNNLVLGHLDYQKKHEPCLYGWKTGDHFFIESRQEVSVFDDTVDLDKLKKAELRAMLDQILQDRQETSVIYEDKPMLSGIHPTMKPVGLFARLIKNSSKAGGIVLDPFGGSGTTMMACEQLGRVCLMSEIDPRYCDAIVTRWEDFTGEKAVLTK